MKIYITFIITMLFVVSCIPGENPVKPYDRGGVLESSVNIGHFYAEQIYFSLEQYEVVSQNHITDWDIGFACAENDFVIILNYGKFMKVVELEAVDFDTVNKETINTILDLYSVERLTGFKKFLCEFKMKRCSISMSFLKSP